MRQNRLASESRLLHLVKRITVFNNLCFQSSVALDSLSNNVSLIVNPYGEGGRWDGDEGGGGERFINISKVFTLNSKSCGQALCLFSKFCSS